jgi:hypothetical protein
MTTRTLIPVEEYLTTVYRPDCDYVDDEVTLPTGGSCVPPSQYFYILA